jgi:hypothetical protein
LLALINWSLNQTLFVGADEKRTVCIVAKDNIPDFGGKSVGINRVGVLLTRLGLVKDTETYSVESFESTKGDVSHLEISAKETKVQYRCASAESVKGIPAANSIKDSSVYEFSVPQETVALLSKAASAMSSETVAISAKNNKEIIFDLVDSNNDVFSTKVETDIRHVNNETSFAFTFNYPIKQFLALVKASSKDSKTTLAIGGKGLLTIPVSGYTFLIIPQFN